MSQKSLDTQQGKGRTYYNVIVFGTGYVKTHRDDFDSASS